ncbi:GAF domain-containing protein [Pseudomonas phoenicis]|uniref:GAF domain-containing protein n=1 Tax=unclassified Pseudomonas TaxID=196821 RepID=UPI00399F1E10
MRAFLSRFRDRALEVMASGTSIQGLLGEFALALQVEIPDAVVGILVLDTPGNTFRHAVFPAMPATFATALIGNPISAGRGSCSHAVRTGKIVEVPDVASDERFSEQWREEFRKHDLTSLISVPAIGTDGEVHGSLAVIHPMDTGLTKEQRVFLSGAAGLCALFCRYSRTQESQSLLIGELEHRMRNLFSTLSGVAVLTLRNYPQPDQFRYMLDQRMVMMQRAHALALSPAEMPLASLLSEVLSPYSDRYPIRFDGPAILLAKEAAAAFAMVVHELGTNAAKYGALLQPGGELHISWQTEQRSADDAHDGFSLNWQELNGPVVLAPSRKGYGTLMVNGALRNAFNGSAAFTYEAPGFNCLISAPFNERLGRAEPHHD